MPDIPTEKLLQQKPASESNDLQRSNDNQDGTPSADIAALIDTIKNEGIASRAEERREDRGKARRERITIFLLFATVIAIGWQVYEMIHVYGPIHDQAVASGKQADASDKAAAATARAADAAIRQSEIAAKQAEISEKALTQAQRAWIGPTNASFTAEPKAGEPIDILISYQNTGREPALNFSYEVDVFSITETSPEFGNRVNPFMTKCLQKNFAAPGQVVYPSTGFNQYDLSSKTDKALVDAAVIAGDKVVVLQGCFVYLTGQIMRHSFFCFFYKNNFSKISNLNICPSGHSAD
jgi:hypothetical protein